MARRTGIELDHAGENSDAADPTADSDSHISVSVAAETAVSLAHPQPHEPEPAPRSDPVVAAPVEAPRDDGLSIDAPAAHEIVESGSAEAQAAAEAEVAAEAVRGGDVILDTEGVVEDEPGPAPTPDREQISDPPIEPDARPDPLADAPSGVAELFARIKAGRGAAVAQAEEVLDGHVEDMLAPPASPSDNPEDGGIESATTEGPGDEAVADADQADLDRRDAALESIASRLSRKLKRALQDEQNEVLDRLRSHRGPPSDELLPASVDQTDRYRRTSVDLLEDAVVAGAHFISPEASLIPEIGDLAEGLAESLAAPLRRRLQRGLAGGDGDDATATAERISAAYREWKTQFVDRLAADATISAFSRGSAQAAPGAFLRWVVDDDGGPCPDCYDNALAGPTPSGDTYPTGQEHHPDNACCRCLIVPANP